MMSVFAAWTPRRRLLTCGLAAVTVLLLIAAAIVFGARAPAAHRSSRAPNAAPSGAVSTVPPGDPSSRPAPPALPALVRTEDPVVYARAVARALFEVDPATVSRRAFVQFWRGEVPSVVYADAATQGLELVEQTQDVIDNLTSAWIPTQPAWDAEAAQRTTNRFTITSVSVPDYWVNAVVEGTFRDPGLHMERVMGVLTQRYGTNPVDRHSTSRSVAVQFRM